jgi:hypothetical protein
VTRSSPTSTCRHSSWTIGKAPRHPGLVCSTPKGAVAAAVGAAAAQAGAAERADAAVAAPRPDAVAAADAVLSRAAVSRVALSPAAPPWSGAWVVARAAAAAAACHGAPASSARLKHFPIALTDADRRGLWDQASRVCFAVPSTRHTAHGTRHAARACALRPRETPDRKRDRAPAVELCHGSLAPLQPGDDDFQWRNGLAALRVEASGPTS